MQFYDMLGGLLFDGNDLARQVETHNAPQDHFDMGAPSQRSVAKSRTASDSAPTHRSVEEEGGLAHCPTAVLPGSYSRKN